MQLAATLDIGNGTEDFGSGKIGSITGSQWISGGRPYLDIEPLSRCW
jgi:hypothetical protein